MNRLDEFTAIINSKLGAGYVYGGQSDQPLTKEILEVLVNKLGKSHYYFSNYSAERWLGREFYDCSGLIVYTLQRMGLIPGSTDYSAQTLYSMQCVPILRNALRPGDLCFNKTSTGIIHVGVYMGNNRVVHARGTFYGVVNTILFPTFNTFGRLKFFNIVYPEIKLTYVKQQKQTTSEVLIYDQPWDTANIIGKIAPKTIIEIQGYTDNNWFLIGYSNKSAYVKGTGLSGYDQLKLAIEYLNEKTGISKEYWYTQAKSVQWLDTCFIKIAKSFGFVE